MTRIAGGSRGGHKILVNQYLHILDQKEWRFCNVMMASAGLVSPKQLLRHNVHRGNRRKSCRLVFHLDA